jgi:hypothetical protein
MVRIKPPNGNKSDSLQLAVAVEKNNSSKTVAREVKGYFALAKI